MEPLEVMARLTGPIAIPDGSVALDALLAWAVATRDERPPLSGHEAEVQEVEIPIEREPGGRFHLASVGQYEIEAHESRWINRRFPVDVAQGLGDATVRRLNVSAGPTKSFRIPMETVHLVDDTMRWWCVGDADEIRALLPLVTHLGKKRSVGLGRVREWTVETCEPWDGFPVMRDGKPLRPLPHDWPGLVNPEMAYRVLTYPYWQRTREQLCAVP